MRSLYILEINPLSVASFANIFFHSIGFSFLYGFLCCAKVFKFNQVPFVYFLRFIPLLRTAVSTLFGTRDWFSGRQLFHKLGGTRCFGDDSSALHLFCTLFLLLLLQLHLRSSVIRSWSLGTPALEHKSKKRLLQFILKSILPIFSSRKFTDTDLYLEL